MKTKELKFNGTTYVCRIVESIDGDELTIAPTTLLDTLQPGSFADKKEGFASREAMALYEEIFYFTDTRSLALPDDELIEELKESNPDWFD